MTGTEPEAPEAAHFHQDRQGPEENAMGIPLTPPEDDKGGDRRGRGRYSLSRLFFNFYLLAMGSFVGVAMIADFAISTALQGITDDYSRRFMRGTIVLVEQELKRHPKSQWHKEILVLDNKFAYPLALVKPEEVKLSAKQQAKLTVGDIGIDSQLDVMYHPIQGTGLVLKVGPLSPDMTPEYQRTIPLELRIRLLTWSGIGLICAVLVWIWIRPIWRDLESLRQTARSLGDGCLDVRAPPARSTMFGLLSETLNRMADRIQTLIASQRELSSAISHELRTPIARLRFALEMLSGTDERAERERLWRGMEGDLEELDNLIDSSLTHARFVREGAALNPVPTDLAHWLEGQVEELRVLAPNLAVTLDLGALAGAPAVALDKKSLPYAVRNLMRNAFKYAKSRVQVSAELAGDNALIHVDDDGIGVAEEDRERIFDAFTRLDRSRDRASGGYGLGLAIVRQVMEAHGGRALAETSPLGGARFTLIWPRA